VNKSCVCYKRLTTQVALRDMTSWSKGQRSSSQNYLTHTAKECHNLCAISWVSHMSSYSTRCTKKTRSTYAWESCRRWDEILCQ